VPKAIALDDDDRPRRRRGAAAVEVEESTERGLVMRILLHSPKDMVAGMIAFAAVSAIIANAIFMQAGRHPSPMFGGSVVVPMAMPAPAPALNPLPRPRPVEAAAAAKSVGPIDVKPLDNKPADPLHLVKPAAAPPAAPSAVAAPSAAPTSVMRPPAPVPPSRIDPVGDLITNSRRVASVQRALTEYGYGQLKPTGTIGSDTQAAIQKFERDRKLPVTGQMSDRLVRELTAMTGKPIE
jgi:hypothetical protein